MVGVPGRSKGCNTCIQRKIRCDQGTPECGNCQRSKRFCGGYQRKLCFVFSDDVERRDPEGQDLNESEDGTVSQGRWKRPAGKRTPKGQQLAMVVAPASARTMPAKTAWRQQFHYHFLAGGLSPEILTAAGRADLTGAFSGLRWLLDLQGVEVRSPALHSALTALAISRVARGAGDDALVARAASLYGDALQSLGLALRRPRERLDDETLAACMALSFFELTEAPPGAIGNFMKHQRGAMALLQMKGPEAFAESDVAHSIFLGVRSVAISPSLIVRQPTFLSEPDWLEAPWRGRQKPIMDEIVDCLMGIPGILQRLDQHSQSFWSSSSSSTTATTTNDDDDDDEVHHRAEDGFPSIIAKCDELAARLDKLYTDFDASVPGPLYWPELSQRTSRLDGDEQGKVFPVAFRFPSLVVANIVTMYWSVVLGLHSQRAIAHAQLAAMAGTGTGGSKGRPFRPGTGRTLSEVFADVRRPRSDAYLDMAVELFRNICQSVEYLSEKETGSIGSLLILPILVATFRGMTELAPENCSREILWALEALQYLKRTCHIQGGNPMGG